MGRYEDSLAQKAVENERERLDRNQTAAEFYAQLSKKLRDIMEEKGKTEAEVRAQCLKNNFPISQSAVSKILSYPKPKGYADEKFYSITLINFVQICKALEVEPGDIINADAKLSLHTSAAQETNQMSKRTAFVFRPNEDEFKGYDGMYHCYFFPTISSEPNLLYGQLTFTPSKLKDFCTAKFSLDTGKVNQSSGEPIKKEYDGELIISPRMGSCYCLLKNTTIGEICLLVFHHMYLNNENLKCRVAVVATASAGDNRRPTIHRMLISREEISTENLGLLRSQLLLNTSDIVISKESLEELIAREGALPPQVAQLFGTAIHEEEFYRFSEFQIRNLNISLEEKIKAICELRNHSTAQKYNKIGTKTDELVFDYLSKVMQNTSDKSLT